MEINVRLEDAKSHLQGLQSMFIGYLLGAAEHGDGLDQQAAAAYYRLHGDLSDLIEEEEAKSKAE